MLVIYICILTAELLVPDFSPFGVEIAIVSWKSINWQILAKLIQAGGEILLSEIHWNKEELADQ
jgi:hypothetical protein